MRATHGRPRATGVGVFLRRHRAVGALLRKAPALVLLACACLTPPPHGSAASAPGAKASPAPPASSPAAPGADPGVCSDAVDWVPEPPPGPCADPGPWTAASKDAVRVHVDAAARGPAWSRFYEKAVAADHANTLRCTAWGRNIRSALRKAHEEVGFQLVRFHGILDDDIGVYSEDPGGAAVYRWNRLDQVYDSILAAGMRPIVEISFTPSAMASDPTKIQKLLWYAGMSPNVSPPKDWRRWQDFMAEIVRHLEGRYGADEVRRWYFEVWNEPSWMYSRGDDGYVELYENTARGIAQGDPQLKVGGPAGSSHEVLPLAAALVAAAKARDFKLDFITYHRYGTDDGGLSDANAMPSFHRALLGVLAKGGFTGEILNDEFGPSSKPDAVRDDESTASFIAKTIHLLGTDASFAPPSAYAYWALSDLYEEFDTGSALAYREGNYGLLLKGDSRFPESYDVAKPGYNAFRLLHMMGDTQLSVTGGTTADGVDAAATLSADGHGLQILVYNHVNGGRADSRQSNLVTLTVDGIPFAPGPVRVRHYVVDRSHANSHTAWVDMDKPRTPTREQWTRLRDAAKLCYYETSVDVAGRSWSVTFPQSVYGVGLLQLDR